MKRFWTLPLVLVFALLVAVPVYAAPPVILTGEFEVHGPAFDPSPCPGFVVFNDEVGTYHMTLYYDNQNNLVRVRTHYTGTDSFYNPANPDVRLVGHFSGTIVDDLRTGQQSASGLPIHITVPGYGTVLVWAGRWSAYPDEHLAGKDSFDDPRDIAAFCSLLAGE